jgi:hypothetical protein
LQDVHAEERKGRPEIYLQGHGADAPPSLSLLR